MENLEINQPHIGSIFKDPLGKSVIWTGIHVVGKGSWKKREVRKEIGKNQVGKFEPKLENFLTSNFPTPRFFQLLFSTTCSPANELDEMGKNESSSPQIVRFWGSLSKLYQLAPLIWPWIFVKLNMLKWNRAWVMLRRRGKSTWRSVKPSFIGLKVFKESLSMSISSCRFVFFIIHRIEHSNVPKFFKIFYWISKWKYLKLFWIIWNMRIIGVARSHCITLTRDPRTEIFGFDPWIPDIDKIQCITLSSQMTLQNFFKVTLAQKLWIFYVAVFPVK